ncbi:DUF1998 domain-containing protein [Marinobacterium rhizophilum]|uniref:DUF1998 domain-containing protein n=1 Tax=Marinobacterium rhizophilum TaxID=420402 RepID=UPI0003A6F344|nr:DUF1998 domain-containing protein [Marinobacterium rhizophilum]
MADQRSVRSSQLISPYGPGAIVDIGDESLLLTDLKGWPRNLIDVKLPRLARELGVTSLKSPPEKPEFGQDVDYKSVTAIRFPRWMFCPSCRKMEYWKTESGHMDEGQPVCSILKCRKRALVPMRFVMACQSGHMGDVPWDYWAHSGSNGNRKCPSKKSNLYFTSKPELGSGLEALLVECRYCKSYRDLGNITSPDAIQSIGLRCTGSQPWETWEEGCQESPVVLQRGASNLYFPVVRSALDIPVVEAKQEHGEKSAAIRSHNFFSACQNLYESKSEDAARSLAIIIAGDNNCTVDDVFEVLKPLEEHKGKIGAPPSAEELQEAEWKVLVSPDVETSSNPQFSARVESSLSANDYWKIAEKIERVVLLDKLREVRAFCGYERVKPTNELIPPAGQNEDIKWLPAIEVFGEGIFIEFSDRALTAWENKSSHFIQSRIGLLIKRYGENDLSYLPEPSARLVVLHTMAHLLIRQLSFECGYSSGSIRERIYAAEGQVGILIYTADSDSEGSLGGLVQQGEAARLMATFAAALDQASWCSNDPVCSEMETQGVMGLNKAACHSCTLVSETSCGMNNLLLDRKLLLGDSSGNGLFSDSLAIIKSGV